MKFVEIDLLIVNEILLILLDIGIGDSRRSFHRAQGFDQFFILVLWLVEQNIDPDRLRALRIEEFEGVDHLAPIKRRAFARIDQRLLVIDNQHDPLILRGEFGKLVSAVVIKIALSIAQHGYRPGKARNQQGSKQQQAGQQQTLRSSFTHIAPAASQKAAGRRNAACCIVHPTAPRTNLKERPFVLFHTRKRL